MQNISGVELFNWANSECPEGLISEIQIIKLKRNGFSNLFKKRTKGAGMVEKKFYVTNF